MIANESTNDMCRSRIKIEKSIENTTHGRLSTSLTFPIFLFICPKVKAADVGRTALFLALPDTV